MMNQQKSRKSSALKYLMIVPLTFSLVLLSSAETIAKSVSDSLQDNKKSTVLKDVSVTGYGVSNTESTKTQDSVAVKRELVIKAKTIKKGNETTAATSQKTEDGTFTVVEVMPKFPGGDPAMFKFLAENVKYPVEAQEKKVQGRVICQFVVDRDGSIDNVKVARSVDPTLDAEAIRVIKAMPNWFPGMQRGKAVKVKFTLPINFRLPPGSSKNISGAKTIGFPKNALVFLDGVVMPSGFDPNVINRENIDQVEVFLANDEKSKEDLIRYYGKAAENGVVKITTIK